MPDIVVIGSLNMDLMIKAAALPLPGETVRGDPLMTFPGGKGANQAVAAARLGAEVAMAGRVGRDAFGAELVRELKASGVDTSLVEATDQAATGTALITVDQSGQNTIVVSAGANGVLRPADMDRLKDVISRAKVLLLQLEIPFDAVLRAIELAARSFTAVILNPAPPCDIPDGLLAKVDCLIPNEIEAERLTGIRVTDIKSAGHAADRLLKKGLRRVIITLGEKGALMVEGGDKTHIPAYPVNAVDATAAGDAFIGCLVSESARGKSYGEAAANAVACGALAASSLGAQASLPDREGLKRFIESQGRPEMVSI